MPAEVTTSEPGWCAVHPDRPSVATCQRCGNFMCDACGGLAAPLLCPPCVARTGTGAFPLTRDTWSVSALWEHCWARFKASWVMLTVAALVTGAVSVGVAMLGDFLTTAAGQSREPAVRYGALAADRILQMVVTGAIQLGLNRVSLDVLDGREVQIARLMSQIHKTGRYVVAQIALFAVTLAIYIPFAAVGLGIYFLLVDRAGVDTEVLIGALVLILGPIGLVPLAYLVLPMLLVPMDLAYTETPAIESIRRAYRLSAGQRLSILGVAILTALVAITGLAACCVGILPAIALGQLLLGGVYLALRDGDGAVSVLPPRAPDR